MTDLETLTGSGAASVFWSGAGAEDAPEAPAEELSPWFSGLAWPLSRTRKYTPAATSAKIRNPPSTALGMRIGHLRIYQKRKAILARLRGPWPDCK